MPIPHKPRGATGGSVTSLLGNTRYGSRPYPKLASSRGYDEGPPIPEGFPSTQEWDMAIEYLGNTVGTSALTDENIIEEVRRYRVEGPHGTMPPLLGPPQPPKQRNKPWASVPTRTNYEDFKEYQRQLRHLKVHGTLLPVI